MVEICYQPKIDLKRKCLAGAEALARIRHPALGVLLPGSFLPPVDEDGIAELTEFALIHTLRMVVLRRGRIQPASGDQSSGQLTRQGADPGHCAGASAGRGALAGPDPGVTEDQIVRDIKLAHAVATELRISGICIAIDDFDAGYSSFSSLRELPFAELKIDRSL